MEATRELAKVPLTWKNCFEFVQSENFHTIKGGEYNFGLKTLRIYVDNILPWLKIKLFIAYIDNILMSLTRAT